MKLTMLDLFYLSDLYIRLSHWPCGLRHRSAETRMLRFCVRIPPVAWMSNVNVVCCQVEVSSTS